MKHIRMSICLLLSVLISVLCVFSVDAVSLYTDGEYTYADIDRYHVALYDYSGESDILTVPQYFSDRIVSEIYSYAFENNTQFKQIDFSLNPDYITSIGTKSFAECSMLTGELNLPSSVSKLGFAAFQGCERLTSLTVNMGIKVIPSQCFNRCYGLSEVYLAGSVESLESLAFGNCSNLNRIYIPTSVTYINDYAFTNTDPVLYVYKDSYAHQYAIDNSMDYVLIDFDDYYFLQGDVNGDGDISISDVTLLQRIIASMTDPDDKTVQRADADLDGDISVQDATLLQRYASYYETGTGVGVEYIEYTI